MGCETFSAAGVRNTRSGSLRRALTEGCYAPGCGVATARLLGRPALAAAPRSHSGLFSWDTCL